jgi:recombinational DNA repair ATPase RecF
MKIRNISIHNFRALEDIQFSLNPHANVIVGPNAIGKSTILEAIRLAKVILAPRMQSEGIHVLQHLGASSPQRAYTFASGEINIL